MRGAKIAAQGLAWARGQDLGGQGNGSRGSSCKHGFKDLQVFVEVVDSVVCLGDLSPVLARNASYLIASCSAPFATVIAIFYNYEG